MRTGTIERFRCPGCGAAPLKHEAFQACPGGEIATGVVWCGACGAWFPIEEGILELLHGPLAYAEDRAGFASANKRALRRLGLEIEAATAPAEHSEMVGKQQAHFDWYADNEE